MKIDEGSINHVALLCIGRELNTFWDMLDDAQDKYRFAVLAEINGMITLAEEMKKVLKV